MGFRESRLRAARTRGRFEQVAKSGKKCAKCCSKRPNRATSDFKLAKSGVFWRDSLAYNTFWQTSLATSAFWRSCSQIARSGSTRSQTAHPGKPRSQIAFSGAHQRRILSALSTKRRACPFRSQRTALIANCRRNREYSRFTAPPLKTRHSLLKATGLKRLARSD